MRALPTHRVIENVWYASETFERDKHTILKKKNKQIPNTEKKNYIMCGVNAHKSVKDRPRRKKNKKWKKERKKRKIDRVRQTEMDRSGCGFFFFGTLHERYGMEKQMRGI